MQIKCDVLCIYHRQKEMAILPGGTSTVQYSSMSVLCVFFPFGLDSDERTFRLRKIQKIATINHLNEYKSQVVSEMKI